MGYSPWSHERVGPNLETKQQQSNFLTNLTCHKMVDNREKYSLEIKYMKYC